jgi:hypothetical protein
MSKKWTYIEDGVYVSFDDWDCWLHANDHEHPTDKIYLEDKVIATLFLLTNERKSR